ncbi:hypothetical protein MHLP_01400 [Candidatus Mycoplasma haematolamae str. Purdue]|uniref:Uncharacterized protein n=1 Tax=Mycoplasma haematolamae (strain Purdue) TaxID=1212765 RepID=I7B9A3_MYCHA|nr:hypothetical protein [Candidatus Mycoplasma haematolamae]AFO51860.1 hypothetical protein MHLP_01400 [Candidatus Mycoplasma haematolamae str. Purdue]
MEIPSKETSTVNLEREACSKLFDLVQDYLNKLVLCTGLISDLTAKSEETFDFVGTSFALLRELGRIGQRTAGISTLVNKYKEILIKAKHSDTESLFKKDYSGDQEWVDEVNYIYIWVLNTYSLDLKTSTLSDVQSRYSKQEQAVELELEPEVEYTSERNARSKRDKKQKQWSGYSVYRNLFRTGQWSFGSTKIEDDDNSFESIVSKTQALERLERDIRSGRVYVYLDKPAKNPKLKKILTYLLTAGLFASSAAFIKSVVSAFSNGSSGSNGFSDGGAGLFSIMAFIYFLLARRENQSGLDNDNFKYLFSRKIFYYWFFLCTFWFFKGTPDYKTLFPTSSGSEPAHLTIFSILLACVVSSITLFMACFFFCNPKKNRHLIESLLHKYSNPPYVNL